MKGHVHPVKSKKKFAMVNLRASNTTSDGVYVELKNTVTNVTTNYYLAPHTPAGTVLGQLVENGDSYNVRLISAGGPHDMWIYWEHQSHVTTLTATGMSIACSSCAQITVFN